MCANIASGGSHSNGRCAAAAPPAPSNRQSEAQQPLATGEEPCSCRTEWPPSFGLTTGQQHPYGRASSKDVSTFPQSARHQAMRRRWRGNKMAVVAETEMHTLGWARLLAAEQQRCRWRTEAAKRRAQRVPCCPTTTTAAAMVASVWLLLDMDSSGERRHQGIRQWAQIPCKAHVMGPFCRPGLRRQMAAELPNSSNNNSNFCKNSKMPSPSSTSKWIRLLSAAGRW